MSNLEELADLVCEVRFRTEILTILALLNLLVLLGVIVWLVLR